ncbi:MAG: hypothetical protein LBQ58_08795 [Synergistaceae bacterium]|jgi:hypothetical protein|nr:hypothetical protein [Synergistaceae bacterium]
MTTQTVSTERQEIIQIIDTLSDDAIDKLASYAAFLRHEAWLDEQEEAEDIADIEARKNEPTIPESVIIAEYEAKYGPLD